MPEYDCIVVGLGAMGSAVAYHAARRGHRVLGLDRYCPPHPHGSSHGESRIIREAYFEHPVYVPMVQRAYELWAELEAGRGTALYRRTGGLMLGAPQSDLVVGALRSAREHGLAHELLDAAEIRRRFPALHPEPDMVGVLEPRAGILFPEACIAAHLDLARAHGATLQFDEPVLRVDRDARGPSVTTARDQYRARALVVTAGAWITQLFPDLALPFTVERQALFWFDVVDEPGVFDPGACPIHLWQFDGRQFFYGFPDLGEGVKLARHHAGVTTTPHAVDRTVASHEIQDIGRLVQRFVPAADGPLRKTAVCLYTNTPDEHFWIDRHPECAEVLIVSPCSGHGFKFSSAIGEIAADWLEGRPAAFDLSLFRARA